MKRLIAVVAALFLSTPALSAHLKVTHDKTSTVVSDSALAKLKVHTVTVTDPNQGGKLEFKAYDGHDVLDLAFGGRDKWSKGKNINFECADGYKPILGTKDFVGGKFYFAFAKADGKKFAITNNLKDGKEAALDPFYVIWSDAAMQTKERAHNWPYQVVAIGAE